MVRNLTTVLTEIHKHGKTGLLSVAIGGSPNLLKLFFRGGEIYHIVCGNIRGKDCLDIFSSMELRDCSFIPGTELDRASTDLPSTSDIIRMIMTSRKTVLFKGFSGTDQEAGQARPADGIEPLRRAIMTAFVRQVGPAGEKIFGRIVKENWDSSASMQRKDFIHLIDLLKKEIDDPADRRHFSEEAHAIITQREKVAR